MLALLLVLGVAGCGKEVVVGGQKEVDAHATGDGTPEGSPARLDASRTLVFADGPSATHIAGRAQGTVSFDARVSLVAGGSAQVNGPASATVRIDGHDSVRVARGRVTAAGYTAVRVVFTRVTTNVTGGLVIGGVGLTGQVDVFIAPGDSIVVERAVSLGGEEEDVRVLVDLDASAWLSAANPAT
ncbi:MAG TPA: hypothetical protein VEW03_00150, partial [Longimicrobiaceae bacterium]|nr:hypothetical protein [Longimicrobiaceae bacterium]